MRAMKDSGIEWIGQIPQDWSTVKVKFTGNYQSGNSITASAIKESGEFPVYGGNGLRGYTDHFTHNGSHILIGRQGALCGNVHLVNGAFWASEHAVVGKTADNYDTRYIYYLLDVFNLNRLSTTAAQPGISVEQIVNVIIPKPPKKSIQLHIADFLDTKCAEIDALITTKEKTNALLKERRQSIIYEAVTKGLNPDVPMKDSGIEWIGQIPEDWSTVRVKYTGSYKSGNTITAADVKESGNFPVYGGNGLRGYTDEITHDGDHLLIGRQGALCGNVHMVSGKFWASEHAVVGTINANYAIRFLFYVLDVFDLNRLSTSAAQPGISVEQITGVVIPCPTFVEQQEIANVLDVKCAEVDELISANEATIQKLKEYRQSIIYEAVTGKVEL